MIEFKMPKLGGSVTEGTIGRWLKQPGDSLEQYEPMLEVTTDKVDTEVSAPINGTLVEILVPEGETVSVGTTIARLDDTGAVARTNGEGAVAEPAAAAVSDTDALTPGAQPPTPGPRAPISPVVARLVAEHGIDLAQIRGTGGGGRVTKKDVEAYLRGQPSAASQQPAAGSRQQPEDEPQTPAPTDRRSLTDASGATVEKEKVQQAFNVGPLTEAESASEAAWEQANKATRKQVDRTDQIVPSPPPMLAPDDELVPLSPMRRAIADHMVKSKQTAPHVTSVMEADLSRIVAHRERNKHDFERQGVKLTFTPYFVQAVVTGLQEVPIVNASYSTDGIIMHNRLNIGVAVAIPDGLIVPVIKDADDKSLLGLARAVNDLADRARLRRLQPDDTRDGTFTITNHGVSGSIFAMPIINQPQSAILGVGAIQKRVVVVSEHGFDSIAIRPMCYLSLTFDHRLIDGATADHFLGAVKRALEHFAD